MTKYINKNHQQDPSKCIVSVIILRDISAYIETCYSLFVVFLQSVNISVLIHITQYTYTIISILMLNIRRLIQQILNFTLKKEIYRLCGSICLLSDMSSKVGKNNIAQKRLKTGKFLVSQFNPRVGIIPGRLSLCFLTFLVQKSLSNLIKQNGLLDSGFGEILPLKGHFPSI